MAMVLPDRPELVAASSSSTASSPLPSGQAMHLSRPSKLESLPIEAILMIMETLPDTKSLKSFSHSSPTIRAAFKYKEGAIVYAVLGNEIGAAIVHLAMVRLAAQDLRMDTIGRNCRGGNVDDYKQKVEHFRKEFLQEAFKTPRMTLSTFTLQKACRMTFFHRVVKVLMQDARYGVAPINLEGRPNTTSIVQGIFEARRIGSSTPNMRWAFQWGYYMHNLHVNLYPFEMSTHVLSNSVYREFWNLLHDLESRTIMSLISFRLSAILGDASDVFEREALRSKHIYQIRSSAVGRDQSYVLAYQSARTGKALANEEVRSFMASFSRLVREVLRAYRANLDALVWGGVVDRRRIGLNIVRELKARFNEPAGL